MQLPSINDIKRELAERLFYEFVKQAWDYVSPDPFIDGQHIRVICQELQLCAEGKTTRLLINIPPGLSKSTLCSILYPCWLWINQPWHRIIIGSHSFSTATDEFNVKARNLIQSKWYQDNWSDKYQLSLDSNAKDFFANSELGERRVSSPGSKVMGFSASHLIIDDPNDPKDTSPVALKRVNDWYETGLYTRLRKPDTDVVIIIQQRLACDDLSGHVLPSGDFKHINLPMCYDGNESDYEWRDSLGQLLCEERFNQQFLEDRKSKLGTRQFNCIYQQSPTIQGGAIIKEDWLRYYTTNIPETMETIQTWDLNFTGTSDFVVGLVLGKSGSNIYVLDVVRGRFTFTETLREIRNLTARYPKAIVKLIEQAANGAATIDTLRHEISGIIPIKPTKSKLDRLNAIIGIIESGNLYLSANAKWLDEFVEEITSFTGTSSDKHDDQLDALVQGITRLAGIGKATVTVSNYA